MLILKDPGAESGVRPRCLNGHPFQFFNSMTATLTKCIFNLLCLVLTLMKFVWCLFDNSTGVCCVQVKKKWLQRRIDLKQQFPCDKVLYKYHKIPKISSRAYIFQRYLLRGLFWEEPIFRGAYGWREICIIKLVGRACSGKEIYLVFFVLLCIRGAI